LLLYKIKVLLMLIHIHNFLWKCALTTYL
jgi:hypothetical protein